MKINISKKQYQTLVKCIEIAGSIYGLMGDMVDDKYKKISDDIDELEESVLRMAEGQEGVEEFVEEFEGRLYMNEDYTDKLLDDIFSYDDYVFWDKLVRELARIELARTIPEDKARKLGEKEMWHRLSKLEEKYWRWAKDIGLAGLEVKDKKTAD